MHIHDLLIVGAGPAGLATAIAATERQLDYQVLEQGILVNSIYRFPRHMVFFTTPDLLEIGGLPLVSPYEKPTRLEALRYYRRVVDTFELDIAYGETVRDVIPGAEESTDRCLPSRRDRPQLLDLLPASRAGRGLFKQAQGTPSGVEGWCSNGCAWRVPWSSPSDTTTVRT